MKIILQFFYNVCQSIFAFIWMLILTIITGKMSKISFYHFEQQSEDINFFDLCSDKYIKTNYAANVSNGCRENIIQQFIDDLSENEKFTSVVSGVEFPIFNGKAIVGSRSYYPVLQDCLKDYMSKLERK